MNWHLLFYTLVVAALGYMLYRYIRSHPEALSKANLSKSFMTMGLLALVLIAFIALCIILLRAG